MTKYFIQEIYYDKKSEKNAGNKARVDVNTILKENHYQSIDVVYNSEDRSKLSVFGRVKKHFTVYKDWKQILNKGFHSSDIIILQFPIIIDSIFNYKVFQKLKKKQVKIILLIHDLDLQRRKENNTVFKNLKLFLYETKFIHLADYIICHNSRMKQALMKNGVSESKLVELQIFDYLMDDSLKIDSEKYQKDLPLVIAGNLLKDKSGYIYQLPDDVSFNLYGVNYTPTEEHENIHYKGSFLPGELPQYLEGSFGLVWDGESSKTCAGTYGEYLKINSPHKTSLYLASQLPVIVWKESAVASFIIDNGCGIAVDSLYDINGELEKISKQEYEEMKKNVAQISQRLRNGQYTLDAINKCQ